VTSILQEEKKSLDVECRPLWEEFVECFENIVGFVTRNPSARSNLERRRGKRKCGDFSVVHTILFER